MSIVSTYLYLQCFIKMKKLFNCVPLFDSRTLHLPHGSGFRPVVGETEIETHAAHDPAQVGLISHGNSYFTNYNLWFTIPF